jgi:hypothetical protein
MLALGRCAKAAEFIIKFFELCIVSLFWRQQFSANDWYPACQNMVLCARRLQSSVHIVKLFKVKGKSICKGRGILAVQYKHK